MDIYVGNLSFKMAEDDLASLFGQYGNVITAKVVSDRETGRSRGFGFVEMDDEDGRAAIEGLHDTEVMGRQIIVNQAKEKKPTQNRGRY